MKKIFTILIILALALCIVACGDDDNKDGGLFGKGKSFTFGKTNENVYESSYIGLGFNLPENWSFSDEDELNSLSGIIADRVDKNIAKQLENATIIYDMMAKSSENGDTVLVIFEKLSPAITGNYTVEELLKNQISMIKSQMKNLGYTTVDVEYAKITVDGRELDGLKTPLSGGGITQTQVNFSAFTDDGYMLGVTCSKVKGDASELLENFYWID